MLRVVVVDDSAVQRDLLLYLLEEDGGFEIVGVAKDGREAIEVVARVSPDIVLMDYHLPHKNGLDATREIMSSTPVPIVIASASVLVEDVASTFEAIRAGALAILIKPGNPEDPAFDAQADELIRTLKLMAEVKVVRRWPRDRATTGTVPPAVPRNTPIDIVAIGSSTGGPAVVSQILSDLPADLPAAILLVQHMSPGFAGGFVTWLNSKTALNVCLATDGVVARSGTVFLAPDDRHLVLDAKRRLHLHGEPAENGFRPSINQLFRSAAKHSPRQTMGVILTGMGRDGAEGLLELRRAGGATIAQDEQSCVVFGMPAEAIRLGAAEHTFNPSGISAAIRAAVGP